MTVLGYMMSFFMLVLAQAVIFNNIVLFNVAMPLVFIYFIVSLPITLGTNLSLTIGFLTGLAVDIFSDTQGLNSLSCTLLTFIRKPVFHFYVQKDEDLGGARPSLRTMGSVAYLKYLFSMTLIYCLLVFGFEAFSFFNIGNLILRVVCSTAFTFVVIYALDSFSLRSREKRL